MPSLRDPETGTLETRVESVPYLCGECYYGGIGDDGDDDDDDDDDDDGGKEEGEGGVYAERVRQRWRRNAEAWLRGRIWGSLVEGEREVEMRGEADGVEREMEQEPETGGEEETAAETENETETTEQNEIDMQVEREMRAA
ncbi:MAG: hypothetical protein Q9187_009748 [Circinaria calcarea]